MAVIPLTELAALEEACIVFWKQKNSAKAFGTASCMNSKLWRGIWGTQKSLGTFAHTCKTHTPYTRLLGNRMFTSTSTGCYQALCNLITIQYCNKVIFQPTMVVKLKATSILSRLTLAIMRSCLTLTISPRSFEWIFHYRVSLSNACNCIQSKYHLHEPPGLCATVKNALCTRLAHVTWPTNATSANSPTPSCSIIYALHKHFATNFFNRQNNNQPPANQCTSHVK